MLDVGWTELLVIAVVLIVVVGPKDLPPMLRAFGKTMARFRSVAGEFQRQFNDALKEADLDDVRQTLSDAKRFHPGNAIREAIAPLRDTAVDLRSDLQKATAAPAAKEPVTLADAALPAAEAGAETENGVVGLVADAVPTPEVPDSVAALTPSPSSPSAPAGKPSFPAAGASVPVSDATAVPSAPAAAATIADVAAPAPKPRAPRRKALVDAPISGATEDALAAQAALDAKPKRVRKPKKDEA